MDIFLLCELMRLELLRRRGERPTRGGDNERSSALLGRVKLLLPVRVCTEDMLGDA